MDSDKSGYNIVINGDKTKEIFNEFKDYIIKKNLSLDDEVKELRIENKELQVKIDELEDENDRYDERKRYERGLMHTLYDMKKKSMELNDLYKSSDKEIQNEFKDHIELL